MYPFYNLAIHTAWFFLKAIGIFSPKLKQFVIGRSHVFKTLKTHLGHEDKTIWMHVASLGEFEQGLPVLEQLRETYPSHKILTTFFSPSGYEVKKNTKVSDIVTYLPMDTPKNVQRFLSLARPELALFVKYEIWPNYLKYLSKNKVPTLLLSARFTKDKVFFKWYGGFMRNTLRKFQHIFVQEETSSNLLRSIGYEEVTISGDTRFDRVSQIVGQDNSLDFMESFKGKRHCVVAGSTWPEDEKIIVEFINTQRHQIKFVVAPHTLKKERIQSLKDSVQRKVFLYSELERANPGDCDVLIVDTIGLLTKIYSYADVAYVGGGFGTGLHNTLEPAVFGIPVLIGPDYEGFNEVRDLVAHQGIKVVRNPDDFSGILNRLIMDDRYRQDMGRINGTYVKSKGGASIQIMDYIRTLM